MRGAVVIASCAAAALLVGGCTVEDALAIPSGRPQIRVTPAASLEDQQIVVRVGGLAPGQLVAVGLRSTDAKGFAWTSSARFSADSHGDLDLSRASSRGGSYTGTWPMGLIASMRSTRPDPYGGYFWRRAGASVFAVAVTAHGHTVASSSFRRSWTPQALDQKNETVSSAGFVGAFDSPPTARKRPTVLVLGGSEGGLRTSLLTARFAADGVPALALAYFDAPRLPATMTNIPLEYFRGALSWLTRQPQVDPHRIVVLGISRGSEAALLLGVHYPELVHGVVALVPSGVVNCGIKGGGAVSGCTGAAWTLAGKPLPYTEQFDNPSPTDVPAAVIPVESINGPLLLACGGIDETWPSCRYAEAITNRLTAKHAKAPESYTYLNAGHALGALLPDEPGSTQRDLNVSFDEQAREALWPHVLRFVRSVP